MKFFITMSTAVATVAFCNGMAKGEGDYVHVVDTTTDASLELVTITDGGNIAAPTANAGANGIIVIPSETCEIVTQQICKTVPYTSVISAIESITSVVYDTTTQNVTSEGVTTHSGITTFIGVDTTTISSAATNGDFTTAIGTTETPTVTSGADKVDGNDLDVAGIIAGAALLMII
ncbi:hypothetical protein EsH8_VI_000888 [Colletotrichum jinshuiense]